MEKARQQKPDYDTFTFQTDSTFDKFERELNKEIASNLVREQFPGCTIEWESIEKEHIDTSTEKDYMGGSDYGRKWIEKYHQCTVSGIRKK